MDIIEGTTTLLLYNKLYAYIYYSKELVTTIRLYKLSFPKGILEYSIDALHFSLINYTIGGRIII